MMLATILMLGLGSCLFIASSAFDGNTDAVKSSRAAEIQADMMIDLNQAKSFITRTTESITFTVPDRDDDGSDETLTYAWTGLPTAELTYGRNGSPPVTMLEDVREFRLAYLDRSMDGDYPPLQPFDPNLWGSFWKTSGTFGFETVFPYNGHEEKSQLGTLATLSEDATLKSISAHFTITGGGGKSPVRFAIYDVDASNNPRNLLASTASVEVSSTGWTTLNTAPIALTAGNYYLALSIQRATKVACNYALDGSTTQIVYYNAAVQDFKPTWGTSDEVYSMRASIYATYSLE